MIELTKTEFKLCRLSLTAAAATANDVGRKHTWLVICLWTTIHDANVTMQCDDDDDDDDGMPADQSPTPAIHTPHNNIACSNARKEVEYQCTSLTSSCHHTQRSERA